MMADNRLMITEDQSETRSVQANRRRVILATLVAAVVLISSGLGQRWLDRQLVAADAKPVPLGRPLSALALEFGPWRGTEIPLDQRVVEVAGCDDYVYRRYVDESAGDTVDLYVSYAARPAKMLGHRPQVCYPAHGWIAGGLHQDRLTLSDGSTLDCLMHRFSKSRPDGTATVVVLNYYILRGQHVIEWTDFWGPRWRMPNLARDPSFYVAQVQVVAAARDQTSVQRAETLTRRFAAEIATPVRALLPTVNGQ
jgi:EpsI family protein